MLSINNIMKGIKYHLPNCHDRKSFYEQKHLHYLLAFLVTFLEIIICYCCPTNLCFYSLYIRNRVMPNLVYRYLI